MSRTCALLVVAFAVQGGVRWPCGRLGCTGAGRNPTSRKVGSTRLGTWNLCEDSEKF